jgi:hypothetical protein
MESNNSGLKGFLFLAVFGGIFVLVGAFIIMVGIGVIDGDVYAPSWVIIITGLVFGISGIMVMVNGLREMVGLDNLILRRMYHALLLFMLISFAVPFHWVAFGSGERQFSSSTSLGGVSVSGSPGGNLGSRIAFGVAALFIDLIIVWVMVRIVRGDDLGRSK